MAEDAPVVKGTMPPPTDRPLRLKKPLLLGLQLLWIAALVLPCILLAVVRTLLRPFKQLKSLRGQVALVTGAGRGLGRGLALRLAEEGCKVAVVDINRTTAEETAEEIRQGGGVARAYSCNVAKVEEVHRLGEAVSAELGAVELLVNNAGLIYSQSISGGSDSAIKAVIDVNLTSNFWMVREFLPAMRERNSGHIVAIASIAALIGGPNGWAYCASKFGLDGLMECVHAELNEKPNNHIKTTTVYPYFINTSALYVDHWNLRSPPISIDETVDAIVFGIKSNQIKVGVPFAIHPALNILRVLPQYVRDIFLGIFWIRISPLTKEEFETTPTNTLMQDLSIQYMKGRILKQINKSK